MEKAKHRKITEIDWIQGKLESSYQRFKIEKQMDGPVCRVLALEAVPAAAAVFQKSVEWNNLTDVIQAGASDNFALGEFKDDKMQLFILS